MSASEKAPTLTGGDYVRSFWPTSINVPFLIWNLTTAAYGLALISLASMVVCTVFGLSILDNRREIRRIRNRWHS